MFTLEDQIWLSGHYLPTTCICFVSVTVLNLVFSLLVKQIANCVEFTCKSETLWLFLCHSLSLLIRFQYLGKIIIVLLLDSWEVKIQYKQKCACLCQ